MDTSDGFIPLILEACPISTGLTASNFSFDSFDKDEMDELVCDGAARSQYSLTYLEPLSRRFGAGDNVTIQFGENFPLAMNFTFENGAAEVDYFLAPRVESDY